MFYRLLRSTIAYDVWLKVRRAVELICHRPSTLPLPHAHKVRIIQGYARANGLRVFVETGTFFGETSSALRRNMDRVLTIELDRWLCARAKRKFRRDQRVQVLCGDSANLLPRLVPTLDDAALFWLDGHFSGGITARGREETPVIHELDAILSSQVDHVILIDDARAFDGRGSYPSVAQLRSQINKYRPTHVVYVADDIIRIHSNHRKRPG